MEEFPSGAVPEPHDDGAPGGTPGTAEPRAAESGAAEPDGAPHDEVDRIVAAWLRVRPDLDLEPLTVFSRISRLARHLDLARRRAFARRDLEIWEFDVLSALRRAGEPYRLSPGALVQQTLVTSGTMTNRIDRLADRGFVERHRSPDDRRGVQVELTTAGLKQVDAAMADLLAVEADVLSALDKDDRPGLAALLRTLATQFEE
ncbi:MarR family winged helix-turn-helix transcriptional regulator [Myceligenerans pegani]|uniref:MarR family transcriptional regulator n=1 Tax=Myceligenerans pegani TaxID=2776917 RepID=A0ABR9MTD2_9MICO|nr:MarR family transcriptional regulator [Myceligenerans sp. TRM 65318]MBE1874636.1 MarR family transcriptional regulator [Myceligenerans sp. TRM 65318]MBE3016907.1 MarR family transcriptional regulator [Myceligenerans sp. TRM 65318]